LKQEVEMIIIGERINATRKNVGKAIAEKNAEFIRKECSNQIKNGAHYIDLNAGLGRGQAQEKEDLLWLVNTVQETGEIPLCLDSSDPQVIEGAIKQCKSEDKMINSISGEKERIEGILPIIEKYPECKIIALTMDDSGIPAEAGKRVDIAEKLISLLREKEVKDENIFVDFLAQPVGTGSDNGIISLETLKKIKQQFPKVKTTCGLSNISFGLPERETINKYFLALSIGYGMDSAIVDPTVYGIREAIFAAEALIGKDEFCMNYIKNFRENVK
jgi:5-methyltetrahydrofolate--homocysteine methyltransferase